MKKMIMGACALMALAAVSCGKCESGSCSSTAATDSLSTAYGTYVGSMIYGDYSQMGDKEKAQKQEFLRGMQIVFGADDSRDTRMGMQVAIQMMTELQQLEQQGITINKAAAMSAFKSAFLADSLPYSEMQGRALEFQRLYMAAQQKAQAEKEAGEAQAPEAVQNGEKAEAYVAAQKAENADVRTTESGLSYLIANEGDGQHPDENATVVVNYTGKHIDGEVFDTTDGRGPATFNLQGVVPGFREGLMLLGKGGKATLYIPGKLAYGNQGQPAAGIGPNEMLIFDVELLDVNPAN
ncbi:MAG: FKBP-type peptidyl-prolyl cis-trans isomerase [Muribaculaceae bacterium]|nr:FKBP-type peptidyl-prolyl cis-trans isomerase [Muribaculaceae bacterium]